VLIWQLASMDGGAFYATSEATEIIADHEEFFKLEQRCDEEVQVTGIEARNWAAFEHDGRTLVLLMSFDPDQVTATVTMGGQTVERTVEAYGTEVVVM